MTGAICGAGIVVLAFVLRFRAFKAIMARWRALDRRGWSKAVSPARRAWPFNWFVFLSRLNKPERWWEYANPTWAEGDAAARRALRLYRLTSFMIFIGMAVFFFSIVLRPAGRT